MLQRVLEPEVMDSAAEAQDYDTMDHSFVNQLFVSDLLQLRPNFANALDVGTGTAQIPIELCKRQLQVQVIAIDMAEHMLRVGNRNVERAGFAKRIQLQRCDAKKMPFENGSFDAVISNSIVHHIPAPLTVFSEMARVVKPGGVVFVRDLLRPSDAATLKSLVQTYAVDANAHQQKMFGESLHAALTLAEVRDLVRRVGFDPADVAQTSDRHWTLAIRATLQAAR
jgi:ubiquinone/menaquinone biosynthesis C-methylase UbiE